MSPKRRRVGGSSRGMVGGFRLYFHQQLSQVGSCTRNTVTIEGMALCGEAGDVLSTGPLWDEVSTLQCSRAW